MIIVTSEYIFLNPKIDEINDIKNNKILGHSKNYGEDSCEKVIFKNDMKLFDKIKNRIKYMRSTYGVNRTL